MFKALEGLVENTLRAGVAVVEIPLAPVGAVVKVVADGLEGAADVAKDIFSREDRNGPL